MQPQPNKPANADRCGNLTDREQQVTALVCKGLSNKLIARRLNVSEGTIKAHLHAVFSKLGLGSRFALIDALVDRPVG
jgi:two-component system nitrate/nitrite response regulator NarL